MRRRAFLLLSSDATGEASAAENGEHFLRLQGGKMPNHLTPEELSKELGIDRQEVIKVCMQESIPIYQGKIDKTLFQAQLQALGAMPQHH
jgi:hypothetical protein